MLTKSEKDLLVQALRIAPCQRDEMLKLAHKIEDMYEDCRYHAIRPDCWFSTGEGK